MGTLAHGAEVEKLAKFEWFKTHLGAFTLYLKNGQKHKWVGQITLASIKATLAPHFKA